MSHQISPGVIYKRLQLLCNSQNCTTGPTYRLLFHNGVKSFWEGAFSSLCFDKQKSKMTMVKVVHSQNCFNFGYNFPKNLSNHNGECAGKKIGFPAHCAMLVSKNCKTLFQPTFLGLNTQEKFEILNG